MNTAEIDAAREVVRAGDESPAKARLLKFLDHCETLLKGTLTVLVAVGQSAHSVTRFHDSLVAAREDLKKVHDVLVEFEKTVMQLCIAGEAPNDVGDAVRRVIRSQSRELNDLLWALPTISRRTAAPIEPGQEAN